MSDSPRTDFQDNRGNGLVRADFARNLERELAAVQRLSLEDVDKVHDKLDVAQARIAELERCHKLWQADSERYRVTMNDADKRIAELEETIERLQDSRRRRVQKESDAAWDRGEKT